MKFIFTLSLLAITLSISAQWSNTNDLFADSLHMPVSVAAKTQNAPLVVRSYPDSGYFVIWQDYRNSPTNAKCNIYAQKFSSSGTPMWTVNGVPISSGTNQQHYTYQGQYYGNHSYAATDSAGGFYIGYSDDSSTNVLYERACVQHIRNDGSAVFPGPGFVVYPSTSGNFKMSVQLIGDGNGGFFISYLAPSSVGTPSRAYIYCYKDVNGSLQSFGGGQMNENAIEQTNSWTCGHYMSVAYPDANVDDYHIFSDMQGGCNIVMDLSGNGAQGVMIAYNKLFRAKANARATQYVRGDDYNPVPGLDIYQQGNVYRLYYLKTDHQQLTCASPTTVITVTQFRVVQQGYLLVNGGALLYDLHYPKGVTVSTSGNTNVSFVAASERAYSPANGISSAYVRAYSVQEEVYDSIPYQRASSLNPDYPGYNTDEPASLNKLTFWRDTLLAGNGGIYFDFSLAGGSNQVYAAGLIAENNLPNGYRNLRMQHIAVEPASADSFDVVYKTNLQQGVIVGQDQQNYFFTPQYDFPRLEVNRNGNALFYIKSNDGNSGPLRVSPILSGVQFAWGAMGRAVGTAVSPTGSFYNLINPILSLDPTNGTALMAWDDTRNASTTGEDIYMFHLDNLNDAGFRPPYKRLRSVTNPFGSLGGTMPMYGTSNKFTTFEVYDAYGNDPGTSPVADISDNYNLGNVTVRVYQNNGPVRTYNGKPYLDRSFIITPEHNPNGAATVTIRLFFTTAEFNALKAADPTITTPGDLAVIKQPSGSGSTYSVVAGEQTVIPQSWAAVTGGYYIELQVTSFSNFFIFKNLNAPLPVKWLGIQAQWQNPNEAKVSWQVAEQQNVDKYVVQQSINGNDFADACSVAASSQTQYNCTMAAGSGHHYYRVMEVDLDGRKTFSRTVMLQAHSNQQLVLYPNPVKDLLYITGPDTGFSIQLIDAQGRIIKHQTLLPGTQSIDISSLSKGNYLLKVISKSDTKTLRFTKE